jgi:hypothetical protein
MFARPPLSPRVIELRLKAALKIAERRYLLRLLSDENVRRLVAEPVGIASTSGAVR